MQQYFQISKYFMLILIGIFFVAALIAMGTPPRLVIHNLAVNIGTLVVMISPVAAISTLITGIASMRQVVDERQQVKRKISELQNSAFEPDQKRIEYILSQLKPEDRAYLEFYYAMRDQHEDSRLSEEYSIETTSMQHQAKK
jgi:hypothetical protein